MHTITRASEARSRFADLVNRVAYGKERIVIQVRSRPKAALVPFEDLELLEALEARIDLEDARAALREAKRKGTKPLDQVVKELGIRT